jgi:hypothetical protein
LPSPFQSINRGILVVELADKAFPDEFNSGEKYVNIALIGVLINCDCGGNIEVVGNNWYVIDT